VLPQESFITNSRFKEQSNALNEVSVLHWSNVGTIEHRRHQNYNSIDVNFADTGFHRNFVTRDDYKISMATMNFTGLVMASKGEDEDLDKYEEDEDIQDKDDVNTKSSYLYFRPFDSHKHNGEWHYKMQDGEHIESVAQGSQWVACSTDNNYIRVFSTEGVQKTVISQSQLVVTMAGYENLLAVVYHAGLPIFDQQQLRCKIIDCSNFRTVFDGQCPCSRNSQLTWVGFSEAGMLTTMDSFGVISSLNFQSQQWIPLLDLKSKFPQSYKNIWVVSFDGPKLYFIELPKGAEQPPTHMR